MPRRPDRLTLRARQAAQEGPGQLVSGDVSTVSTSDDAPAQDDSILSVAITPLGVPLLAGPGTIVTAMGYSADGRAHALVTLLGDVVLCGATWICFALGGGAWQRAPNGRQAIRAAVGRPWSVRAVRRCGARRLRSVQVVLELGVDGSVSLVAADSQLN